MSERRDLPTGRLNAIQYTVAAVFAALALSYWYIQVVQHQKFQTMADNNHQRTLELAAPRGTLFDRRGRVLVENRHSFNVSLVREQVQNLDQTLDVLSGVTGTDLAGVRATLERHRREPLFRPVVLIRDATLAQVAAIASRRVELPGIVIEEVPTRHYPSQDLAAHLFGYVGEVTDAQLTRAEYQRLHTGDIVGQSGVEQAYNRLLMGNSGARHVVVNSLGREIDTIGEEDAIEGKRLQLTIDYDLQHAAEDAFRATGYVGAAVILDPKNGEVLSLVSLPSFDPNRFAVGIDRATWSELMTDPLTPLTNRAIQGRYSPGSTFKIAVAVAALEEGVVTPDHKVFCAGGGIFHGRYHKCHLAGGHGWVDMRQAIEKSCNVYFYTVGNMVGIDKLHKWATALGLGERTGIDLPAEMEGLVPSSAWKLRVRGERWYPGETTSVSIGQGQVSVTPVSQAVMMATVANGGSRVVPHLVRAINDGTGWKPNEPAPASTVALKPETMAAVREGLWRVVNGQGTGGRARIEGRDVAGKTGTAQVISNEGKQRAHTDRDLRDHGWFVFFAPASNPQIAGAIFAEHAEHGYLAAPIARHIIQSYFAIKEGQPLPTFNSTRPPATLVADEVDDTPDPPTPVVRAPEHVAASRQR
ncbi:MAG: penicillin-binding protein 2 [Vicinamibacterales bacterium]